MAETPELTHADASRLLGVSVRTLYRYAERYNLRSELDPLGRVLFFRSEVESLKKRLDRKTEPVDVSAAPVPTNDSELSALRREVGQLRESVERLKSKLTSVSIEVSNNRLFLRRFRK